MLSEFGELMTLNLQTVHVLHIHYQIYINMVLINLVITITF